MTKLTIGTRRLPGRQSLLLCALVILVAVAAVLWTAPLRLERKLRSASLQELEAASRRRPDAPRPAYYLGRRWLQLGNLPAAHAAFERAAHHAADDEAAWLGYAMTAVGPTAPQQAASILTSYLTLHPESAAAHLALSQVYRRMQAPRAAYPPAPPLLLPDAVSTPLLLRDADTLFAQNRLPEAKHAYLAIVSHNPRVARAWQGAGLTARAQGELEDAYYFLERATDLDERLPQAQFMLGNWYLGDGFKTEAARRLGLAATAASNDPACWHALGQADTGLDVANAQAEEAYRRAVQLAPRNVVYLLDLADLLVVNNHSCEAEPLYRRALAVSPHDADALSRFGGFLLDAHPSPASLMEASRALEGAVHVDPNSDFAWYQLGRLATLRGDDRQAIQALRHAVTLAPQIAEGWYALSRAYQRAGDRSRAAASQLKFRRLHAQYQERTHTYEMLGIHPHDDMLHKKLARLYVLDGEYAKAIFEYATYLRLYPQDAAVQRETAELQTRLKRQGRMPSMSLFSAMISSSRRHNPRPKSG